MAANSDDYVTRLNAAIVGRATWRDILDDGACKAQLLALIAIKRREFETEAALGGAWVIIGHRVRLSFCPDSHFQSDVMRIATEFEL